MNANNLARMVTCRRNVVGV